MISPGQTSSISSSFVTTWPRRSIRTRRRSKARDPSGCAAPARGGACIALHRTIVAARLDRAAIGGACYLLFLAPAFLTGAPTFLAAFFTTFLVVATTLLTFAVVAAFLPASTPGWW